MKIPQIDLTRQLDSIQQSLLNEYEKVLHSGQFILGPFVEEFENAIAGFIGVKHAIGCNSGTDALVMALMALNIGTGDEVITSPFSFFASGAAIARTGATPVFADIDPDTFLISSEEISRKLSPGTKAIIPVHLFGQTANMDDICAIAEEKDLHIIEDAAQSIGATWRNQSSGTLGSIGCFSFYPTKNLSAAGDAGLLTTDDDHLAKRLKALRSHGEQSKYHHSEIGLNSRLSALNAVTLSVKLKHLPEWNKRRQLIGSLYRKEFEKRNLVHHLHCQVTDPYASHVYHQFSIRTEKRDELHDFLEKRGIGSAIHYPDVIYKQPCFDNAAFPAGLCPVAEGLTKTILSLPMFPELKDEEVLFVVDAIEEFFRS